MTRILLLGYDPETCLSPPSEGLSPIFSRYQRYH
jgi:hypothetical protein